MTETMLHLLELAGHWISVFGVVLIVAGFATAAVSYASDFRRLDPTLCFHRFKVRVGRALLLGLEVLVVADVIETITVEPTFLSLAVLAMLVILRTILSWTLTLQVEGRWPWQPERETA